MIPPRKKKMSDIWEKYDNVEKFFLFIYAPLLYYSANRGMFIPDCCFLNYSRMKINVILYETYK